jgi:hypothetical protein
MKWDEHWAFWKKAPAQEGSRKYAKVTASE